MSLLNSMVEEAIVARKSWIKELELNTKGHEEEIDNNSYLMQQFLEELAELESL